MTRSWPSVSSLGPPPPRREPHDYGPFSARVSALVGRIGHLDAAEMAALEAAGPDPERTAHLWAALPGSARRSPDSIHADRAARDAAVALWRRRRELHLPVPDQAGRARWRSGRGQGHPAVRAAAGAAVAIAVVEPLDPDLAEQLAAAWSTVVGLPPADVAG